MRICFIYGTLLILLLSQLSCSTARYPIDEHPLVKIDSCLLGKWRSKNKGELYTLTRKDDYRYLIVLKDKKEKILKIPAYLSLVNNSRFLNFPDMDADTIKGYSFGRLIDVDTKCSRISCAMVADSTLEKLNSSAEVRSWITKNLDNPLFYKDTIVLHRVK